MNFDFHSATIYKAVVGSRAYGTAGPDSDTDVRGVCIPPLCYFKGFAYRFEQYEGNKANPDEQDLCIYDIRKFFKLAAECNPNVLEVLFVPERCHMLVAPEGRQLLANRELFLSKKARWTYAGYAHSQMGRIRTHRRYLLHPPTHNPTRQEYGLPDAAVLSKDIYGAIADAEKKGWAMPELFSANVLQAYYQERRYLGAKREWDQYENWTNTRNPKRAALEAKYGYDAAFACHLVRLARSCTELLTTGQVLVERPDAEELLAIRNGAWTYEQLEEYVAGIDGEMDKHYEACTVLPHTPDLAKLNALCVELVDSFHNRMSHDDG